MKCYLAGPMRGYKDFNFAAFMQAAKWLRTNGWVVFNPAERDIAEFTQEALKSESGDLADIEGTGFDLRRALAVDLDFVCRQADAVVLLPGWEKSSGARAEHAAAVALDLDIFYLREEDYNGH